MPPLGDGTTRVRWNVGTVNAGGSGVITLSATAPDIAGQDLANPLAAILSMALMLRYSFDRHDTAARVEAAVRRVLAEGYRTGDIAEPGCRRVGTMGMGDAVVRALGAN